VPARQKPHPVLFNGGIFNTSCKFFVSKKYSGKFNACEPPATGTEQERRRDLLASMNQIWITRGELGSYNSSGGSSSTPCSAGWLTDFA